MLVNASKGDPGSDNSTEIVWPVRGCGPQDDEVETSGCGDRSPVSLQQRAPTKKNLLRNACQHTKTLMPPYTTDAARFEILLLLGRLVVRCFIVRPDDADISLDLALRSLDTDHVGQLGSMVPMNLGNGEGVSLIVLATTAGKARTSFGRSYVMSPVQSKT